MDLAPSAQPQISHGLPRARGDGPGGGYVRVRLLPASPRSRGWTVGRERPQIRRRGFPALAGMDPHPAPPPATRSRLPRARGDGPMPPPATRRRTAASPRSRGWTRRDERAVALRSGFPALAGMDPMENEMSSKDSGLPRARGDGPSASSRAGDRRAASPRSRGWTRGASKSASKSAGFPALAGMDPASRSRVEWSPWLPRARGDGPARRDLVSRHGGASPRSRGWTLATIRVPDVAPGFPALAGMDLGLPPPRSYPGRLPRARGDGPDPGRGPRDQ